VLQAGSRIKGRPAHEQTRTGGPPVATDAANDEMVGWKGRMGHGEGGPPTELPRHASDCSVENTAMPIQTRRVPLARSAFSLVEMLVVIGILVVLLAIIIPVVGNARRAARNVDTRATLTSMGQAVVQFQLDQKHLPGYFSPRQMGAVENSGSSGGFSSCDNIMLDLLGGVTTKTADDVTVIAVGPNVGDPKLKVSVDLTALGSSTQAKDGTIARGYFTYDAKKFVRQDKPGQRSVAIAPGSNDNGMLPSLVDAFGQPVLAWVQDEIPSQGNFAMRDAPTANSSTPGANFYWSQNAAFLTPAVSALGKIGEDQSFLNNGSLLCDNNTGNAPTTPAVDQRLATMWALLGNASDPTTAAANGPPNSARSQMVLHSAGADGVYVGHRDTGGRLNYAKYEANKDPFGGPLFDDIIQSVGQ
jgi:prepilin-type N-terminal cleavage/methylation domain-containing protein